LQPNAKNILALFLWCGVSLAPMAIVTSVLFNPALAESPTAQTEVRLIEREIKLTPDFEKSEISLPARYSPESQVFVADFDGDRYRDIAVLDPRSGTFQIAINSSVGGGFSISESPLPLFAAEEIAQYDLAGAITGDFDADLRHEILIPHQVGQQGLLVSLSLTSSQQRIVVGLPSGPHKYFPISFSDQQATRIGAFPAEMVSAETTFYELRNTDRLTSVASAKLYFPELAAIHASTDGASTNPTFVFQTRDDYNLHVARFTADFAYPGAFRLANLRKMAAGNNSETTKEGSKFAYPKVEAVGDFNGDGSEDILVRFHNSLRWEVIQLLDRRIFSSAIPPLPFESFRFAVGDLERDGIEELAALESTTYRKIILVRPTPAPTRVVEEYFSKTQFVEELANGVRVGENIANVILHRIHIPGFRTYVTNRTMVDGRLDMYYIKIPDSLSSKHYPSQGELIGAGPYVCQGFDPRTQSFGTFRDCPENHYLAGFDDVGQIQKGAFHFHMGLCCPLPHADILISSGNPKEETHQCAEDSIAVGFTGNETKKSPERLLCRQINSSTYSLGAIREGSYWGVGAGGSSRFQEYDLRGVPLALRPGFRRSDGTFLDSDGCIGSPAGAALTRLPQRDCSTGGFRQLLSKTPRGLEPLVMFPDCDGLVDTSEGWRGCKEKRPPTAGGNDSLPVVHPRIVQSTNGL
jgi:hypothetical protein